MNQNPTASLSAAGDIASALATLPVDNAVAGFLPKGDAQWAWRKTRPTCFGDSKNWPGFNNGVNADNRPTKDQKLRHQAEALADIDVSDYDKREDEARKVLMIDNYPTTPEVVPTVEAQGSETGPVEVPTLPNQE